MSNDTLFVDYNTVVDASWLNPVNGLTFRGAQTPVVAGTSTGVAITATFSINGNDTSPAAPQDAQALLFTAPGTNGTNNAPTLTMSNGPSPYNTALPLKWAGGTLPNNFYAAGDKLAVSFNLAGSNWDIVSAPASYTAGMVTATATAQTTANTAVAAAAAAQTTANSASAAAAAAQTSANTALSEIAALIVGSSGKLVLGAYTLQWATVTQSVGSPATNTVPISWSTPANGVDFLIVSQGAASGTNTSAGATANTSSTGIVTLANASGGTLTLSATWVVLYH